MTPPSGGRHISSPEGSCRVLGQDWVRAREGYRARGERVYGGGMARRGEVLESPINGQRAIFRETAEDTGGELLSLDFFVAPGGFLGSEHLHPKQEERIEILSGTLRCRVSGRERSVAGREAIAVPPGTPHT